MERMWRWNLTLHRNIAYPGLTWIPLEYEWPKSKFVRYVKER